MRNCTAAAPGGLFFASKLAQRDRRDVVIGFLAQDQARTLPRRENVLLEILQVDRAPDRERALVRGLRRQISVLMEVGRWIAEGRGAQTHEARDIPVLDDLG